MSNKDIVYSPYLLKHKAPLGALCCNEQCILNLYMNKLYDIYDITLNIYDDNSNTLEIKGSLNNTIVFYNEYQFKLSLSKPYLYWYYFSFIDCYGKHYIGRDLNGDAKQYEKDVVSFQLNVYEENGVELKWLKGKVIYQILPDRFHKVDNIKFATTSEKYIHNDWYELPLCKDYNGKYHHDFYCGNFKGIIDKLDYLKKLNVSVIYLNPIFTASSSHRYDTANYLEIDPMLGTEEDFLLLCNEAQKKDIAIILDGVFNHTGDDSVYFNKYNKYDSIGAFQSQGSPYYNWYRFIEYPNKYYSWWGITTLPSVNQDSSFVDFITKENGVLDKWLKFGVKGFRLDVVDEINTSFLRQINKAIKRYDNNRIVLGEVWEDASNKSSYGVRRTYFNGLELDSVMNYPLRNSIIDYIKTGNEQHLVQTLRELINNYPKKVLDSLMNILGTHDTIRIISILDNFDLSILSKKELISYKMSEEQYQKAKILLKMAYTILYTVPGVPTIFYGDELGIEGYKDPYNRKPMPWGKEDEDLLNYFELLGEIHKEDVYVDGTYQEELAKDGVFVFSRIKENIKIITIVNNRNKELIYCIQNGYDLITKSVITNHILMNPFTAKIVKTNVKNIN